MDSSQKSQSYRTHAAQEAGSQRALDCSRYMVKRGRSTRTETHAFSAAFLSECKAGALIVKARRKN